VEPVTGIALLDWLLGFLDTAGYPLVVGFTILENIFIVGSFTPGETVVIAAAFLSTPKYDFLWWPAVWVSSVFGTVVGSNISYFLGRKGGRDALIRYGCRFRIIGRRIAEAEEYFYSHGSKTVFISRFAAGFKNFVPMIAGVSRMGLPWFETYTLLGAVTYTTLMVMIGYFIGENFDEAVKVASRLGYAGLLLLVLFVAGAIMARRRLRARHRLADEGSKAEE